MKRNTADELRALATHLRSRRDAILKAWQDTVTRDADLQAASMRSRSEFFDHIPDVLEAFEERLCARTGAAKRAALREQQESAAKHGTYRWQQGYDLTEVMREWGRLDQCLLRELEDYASAHPDLDHEVMRIARAELLSLANDGVCASASQYSELQQSEAASRMQDLEQAVQQLKALEMERADAWRQAAHDLRGSAHVIANASAILTREDLPDAKRVQVSTSLHLAASSLAQLLGDLLEHARLEAGQEQLHVTMFDAASLIREFCESTRPLAAERNLFFKCEGPATLPVEGDAIKVQRVLQNLVLNAMKVTRAGGIKVTWEAGERDRGAQWALCVQDTGPGFAGTPHTPLAALLKQVTDTTRESPNAPEEEQPSLHADAAPTLASLSNAESTRLPSGEGIGLAIVKRLCELLGASIELQSSPGRGTTFRVIFPRRYG